MKIPIDLKRVATEVAQGVLQQGQQPPPAPEPKKPHLTAPRAFLIGAGLFTAGRALASSRGRDMLGSVRERLEPGDEPEADEDEDFEDEEYDEPEAEEDEDLEDEELDEPEAEEDEDLDDEEDVEPEAEEDEDFEDEEDEEPEAEEDEDFEDEELDEPEAEEDEDFEEPADEDLDDEPEAEEDEDFDDEEDEEEPRRARTRRARSGSRSRG